MGGQPLSSCLLVVALIALWSVPIHTQTEISVIAKHTCTTAENNRIRFTINLIAENGNLVGMKALDFNNDEIDSCLVTGSSSQFRIVSYINLATGTESNACGMRTILVGGVTTYVWHFRAAILNTGVGFFRGFVTNATCDAINNDGVVTTRALFNITGLVVSSRFAENETGINSYASNSDVSVTAVIYPNGADAPASLQNAKGFYLRNCYSGTDEAVTQNREMIVNSTGCATSTTYAPSNSPIRRPGTGASPIVVDMQYIRATKPGSAERVYITCQVVTCTVEADLKCDNPCSTEGINSPYSGTRVLQTAPLNTNFLVQDRQYQEFAVTQFGFTTPLEAVTVNVNPNVQIEATFATNGLGTIPNGALSVFRAAKGFSIYNCFYSTSEDLTNPVNFVNSSGCFVPNAIMTSFDGEIVLTSSTSNVYMYKSGRVTLRSDLPYTRIWMFCSLAACTTENNPKCINACATPDGGNNFVQFGRFTTVYPLAVYNTTSQTAVAVQVTSGGVDLSANGTVVVGQELGLGVTVYPDGGGVGSGQIGNAKGVYLRQCYVSKTRDPLESEKIYIVDANGCPIPGPYSPSSRCIMDVTNPGLPPYVITCGVIIAREAGELHVTCGLGRCDTVNNTVCRDRCAAGPLTADSNASDLPVTASSLTQVSPVDDRRTAVRANEIITTIIVVTVVVPLVIMGLVAVITYFIVNAQRPK